MNSTHIEFFSALFPHWAEFIFNFNIFINNSRWQLLGVLCNIIITLSWEPLQIWWKTLQGKWPAFFGKSTAIFLWGDLAPWFWASNMYLPLALSGIKNTWHGRYIRYGNRVVYQSLHAQPGYYVITSSRCTISLYQCRNKWEDLTSVFIWNYSHVFIKVRKKGVVHAFYTFSFIWFLLQYINLVFEVPLNRLWLINEARCAVCRSPLVAVHSS